MIVVVNGIEIPCTTEAKQKALQRIAESINEHKKNKDIDAIVEKYAYSSRNHAYKTFRKYGYQQIRSPKHRATPSKRQLKEQRLERKHRELWNSILSSSIV